MPDAFQERGTGERRGLFLHGVDEPVEGEECSACGRKAKQLYRISYDGIKAKYALCGFCWSEARQRWGGFHKPPDP